MRNTTPAYLRPPRPPFPTISVTILFRGGLVQLSVVRAQRPRKQVLAESLGESVRVGVA